MKSKLINFTKVVSIFALAIFNIHFVLSQSDVPCGAPLLTVGTTCNYTLGNASTATRATAAENVADPACGYYTLPTWVREDSWFSFIAPAGGTVIINTARPTPITGTYPYAAMAVYSGPCTSLSQLLCYFQNANYPISTMTGLTPGATYYIRFWGASSTAVPNETYNICLTTPAPQPVNDNCSNATPAAVNPDAYCNLVTPGTIWGATQSPESIYCSGVSNNDDVWFSFVALNTTHYFNLLNIAGSTTALSLSVYNAGVCGTTGMNSLTCSNVANNFIVGNTYLVRVYSTGNFAQTSTFDLCITTPPVQPSCVSNPPAGNTACTATPICNLNGYCGTTSSTYSADTWSQLTSAFCNATIENNSFLSFTAEASTISFFVWVSNSTNFNGIQIMVFSAANCGSGPVTQHACWNPGNVPVAPVLITATGLTVGNQYYIMIDGNAGDVADYVIGAHEGIQTMVEAASVTGDTNLCAGSSLDLFATGGSGVYNWSPSSTLSSNMGDTVTATPLNTGPITYTVSSPNFNPVCPSSVDSIVLSVNPCGGCTTTASNSGPICPGGSVDISTTSVPGATYSWVGPAGFTSSLQNITGVTPPTTPGTYNYTVTVTDGTVTCMSTTTVTVNSLPVVSAGTYSSLCVNDADLALVGSPLGGTFSGTGVTGNLFDPTSGTQTITYDYTDANGCSNYDNVILIVNAAPIVNTGTYSPLCSNDADLVLVGSPVGGTFTGTGVAGNLFDPSSGSQTITYNYTDGNGCSNSAQTTIQVNPLPTVNAGTYPNLCASAPAINLVGTPAGGTFSGTGVTGNQFNPNVGTQIVTYSYTNSNGCTNSAQVQIVVSPLPVVDAGTYAPVCANITSVNLVGTPVGGVFSGTGVTGTSFATNQGTQTITYSYTDANGCSNTDQETITVNPLPNIDAGIDQTHCLGTGVVLTANGGTNYVWDNGVVNGQPFTPNIGSVTYNVVGTDANGCINIDQVTVTVLNLPDAMITSNITSGEIPLTIDFTNNSLNATSYYWNFDNGQTANVLSTANQSTTFENVGNYIVIMVASNGYCQDSDTIIIEALPLSAPWINIPNVFSPNNDGSNDIYFLSGGNIKTLDFMIFNRWGQLVHQLNGMNEFWNGISNNGIEVNDGVYFYKFQATGVSGETLEGQGHITLVR